MGSISCGTIITGSISSPSTTLQIGNFSWPTTVPESGTVLKTSGTGSLSFEPSNLRTAIPETDTTYQITSTDDIVAITGTLDTVLTLPDPASKTVGDLIYVVKEVSGSSLITVNPFSTELISGNSSATLSSSYGSFKLYTNGINWFALY